MQSGLGDISLKTNLLAYVKRCIPKGCRMEVRRRRKFFSSLKVDLAPNTFFKKSAPLIANLLPLFIKRVYFWATPAH